MSNDIYWHLTSWSLKIIPLGGALQSSKQLNVILFSHTTFEFYNIFYIWIHDTIIFMFFVKKKN